MTHLAKMVERFFQESDLTGVKVRAHLPKKMLGWIRFSKNSHAIIAAYIKGDAFHFLTCKGKRYELPLSIFTPSHGGTNHPNFKKLNLENYGLGVSLGKSYECDCEWVVMHADPEVKAYWDEQARNYYK